MAHMVPSNRLGEFLRARRELLEPDAAGVQSYGRRRVPGLRREELAALAGVSPQYYARLEQGRDHNPSPDVVHALARALQLDEESVTYLRRLADPTPRSRRRGRRAEPVRPGLRRLVESWTDQAAVVIGRHRDVLAANRLAVLVNPGFTPGRNLLRDVFLDPAAREIYPDWAAVARGAVSGVRSTADVDDPRLAELVGELSLKSADFRDLWARHDVHARTDGTKLYCSPSVGPIELAYETLTVTGTVGQSLFLFGPEPGSPAEATFRLLRELAEEKQTSAR